jgi:hypothetical protein
MSEDKKCCKGGLVVLIVLIINTFLLAGILCTLKCGMSKCPIMGSKGKMCPITGKVLDGVTKGSKSGS